MAGKRNSSKDITTQAQQKALDVEDGTGNPDTTTSAEAQVEVVAEAQDGPDTSGAPKSEDAPEVSVTPGVPAVTSATAAASGPVDGTTSDTSDTTDVGDGTFGVPGSDGTQRNPNVTSDQVSGIDQMPGNTPEDKAARSEYVEWFATGARCETQYCNKPSGHEEGNVDPDHGWVNVEV